ncbi:transglutaminase family protein [Methanolobus sp. ZRKC3]|uniref:transglutaminase domain-containing protein n=1 Tax=Methanolobus sp. ZRKC3 TaxID=3125786 RepID=UPI0032504777
MRSKKERYFTLVVFLLILSTSLSGCVSEPADMIGDFLGTFAEDVLQGHEPYTIDSSQLTIPVVPAQEPFNYEDIPDSRSSFAPGFEISSNYYYTQFYDNSEGVISIHARNHGENDIFVYEFGLLDTDSGTWYGQETGITLLPNEEKNIGLISVNVPDNSDEIDLKLGMSILVQTSNEQWYEYKDQYFDEFTIDVDKQPEKQEPEYLYNPKGTFEILNDKVDAYDLEVRKMAAVSAKRYPGQYNIYQLCSLFDDTRNNIQYISDPRGNDLWSPPCDTLRVGAGDCDDYAILLSSLIESIGGTSRIYLTDTHAFTAVYIGDEENTSAIVEAIGNYYGPLPVYYTTDEYGSWLMLDPTSNVYPGGLPGGTAPTDNGWTFLNTTKVVVIDIAP